MQNPIYKGQVVVVVRAIVRGAVLVVPENSFSAPEKKRKKKKGPIMEFIL